MLYRQVPKNGDKLSTLGYGCMRFPTNKLGRIIENKAKEQIFLAIDKGVNYFDTAYPYHGGKSEPFLGKVLKENNLRNKVKIATKLPPWSVKNRTDMNNILDKQLKNLQTDYIDYYLVHGLDFESWNRAKKIGIIDFLNESQKKGKIKNIGFSYHGLSSNFSKIVDDYNWIFCLIQYNYLDIENQAGTKGLKYAASKDMAVMVMEPLRGGYLANKPPKEIQEIWNQSEKKWTPAQWALKWVLNNPEVTLLLSGMNNEEHINENIQIASETEPNSLNEKDLELVNKVSIKFRELMKVGCTGCQYCLPCPVNVNIPYAFELYNSYHLFNNKIAKFFYLARNSGAFGGSPALASLCINCGKCVKKCPQNIDIPKELKNVEKDFEGIMTKPIIWMVKKMMKVKI